MNATSSTSSPSDFAGDGLRFVMLSTVPEYDGTGAVATVEGQACSIDKAIERAADGIRSSDAPAIVGLNGLTLEAMDAAIDLAQAMRGRLLPRSAVDPVQARQGVSFHPGLAQAFGADLRVIESTDQTPSVHRPHAVTLAIHERVPNALFMAVRELSAVLRLRDALQQEGVSAVRRLTSLPVNHAIVVLPADTDARVISQWHRMAAQMQSSLRMSVLVAPSLREGNLRGAIETIALRIGFEASSGGVDFASGEPTPCPGLQTHLDRCGCDRFIDTGFDKTVRNAAVFISPNESDAEQCDVWFCGGLQRGIAARVMRFDASMLWLCDDPSAAPADPTVNVLQRLRDAL